MLLLYFLFIYIYIYTISIFVTISNDFRIIRLQHSNELVDQGICFPSCFLFYFGLLQMCVQFIEVTVVKSVVC